jgi:HD-GYP domain-containing protein (c-di-GMP phosphodiesterase class II)
MSLDTALDEIIKGNGTHFHPDVSAAVQRSVSKGEFKVIPQESLYAEAPVVGAFENPTT